MQERLQTETTPRRNFARFMAEGDNGGTLVPAGGEAGREELQMLRKDMAEMKSALQQLLEQQRQTAPAAPPEEDARRRRMRAMAD